jgi:septal ring factor EnvC (AmiA/AmiB activator)
MKETSMKIITSQDVVLVLTGTIERLENELLAATIRIDNDAMEIARLTPLQYRQAPCHKFCEATAFEIEIRALKAELSKVTDELFALSQDDGKIEHALDRANAEVKKLRAELALKIRKLKELSNANALENMYSVGLDQEYEINELREALDALKNQEPVAWYEYNADLDAWFISYGHNPRAKTRPLVFGDVPGTPPVKAGRVMVPKEPS